MKTRNKLLGTLTVLAIAALVGDTIGRKRRKASTSR